MIAPEVESNVCICVELMNCQSLFALLIKANIAFAPLTYILNLLPALHVDAKSKCFIEVDSEMKGFFRTADLACFALE